MFCTSCATANPRNAQQCSSCGGMLRSPLRGQVDSSPAHTSTHRWLRVVQALPIAALTVALVLGVGQIWTARAERAAAYASATDALATGDLVAARDGFARLGDYRDAVRRLAQTTAALAPYESRLEEARAAAAEGRLDDAIAGLVAVVRDLPSYQPAVTLLADVRNQRRAQLLSGATAAERDGDWLAVERALAAVSAEDPTDASLAARLAGVRREHAPVVYARDGVVYVSDPNGDDERAVTPPMEASWPAWNPDRTQIAFIQRHPGGAPLDGTLVVVALDGSGLHALAERAMPFYWPSWSPDGKRLAFASAIDFDEERNEGRIGLHLVDLATGAETDLTGDRLPHAYSQSWSPDGSAIAFVSFRFERRRDGGLRAVDGETYLIDVATRALTDVTRGRIVDEAWVSWSPAGDRLLIFTVPDDWNNPRQSQIFLLDAVSTDLIEIPTHAWELSLPVWSPTGDRFAYVEGDNVVRIWSDAGEDWIQVSTDLAPFISWSPDGSALLVAGNDLRSPTYLLPADDRFGSRTPVTIGYDSSRGNGPPQWTPRTIPLPSSNSSLTGTALDPR